MNALPSNIKRETVLLDIESPESSARFTEFTFKAYHDDFANIDPSKSLAVGACIDDMPAGLVLVRRNEDRNAQVQSIFVGREYRRRGLAFAMLARAEWRLRQAGSAMVEISYRSGREATPALEGLLVKSGWSEPRVRQIYCRTNGWKMQQAGWIQPMELPPEYELISWSDVTDEDRASIRARQAAQPFFPDDLDPLRHEIGYSPVNSLGLRYRGEVVGWLITHALEKGSIRYTCSFLRPDLQRVGRLVALYGEGMRRQIARDGLDSIGVWTVPVNIPRMTAFVRRRFAPYLLDLAEFRISRKVLCDESAGHG